MPLTVPGVPPGGTTGQVPVKTSSADYAAAWQTDNCGGGDYFRSGYYSYGQMLPAASAPLALTQDEMNLRPFVVSVRRAFDRIAARVSTAAGAGGVLRMGIYANGGGMPGSLIVDAGTVSSTSTGSKEITIAQTLDPGVYWLALVAQVSGSTVIAFSAAQISQYISTETAVPSSSGTKGGFTQTGVSGALPAIGTLAASQAALTLLRAT